MEINGKGLLVSLVAGDWAIGDDIDATETLRRRESVLMRLVKLVFFGMNSLAILLREEAALGHPETVPSWPASVMGNDSWTRLGSGLVGGTGGVDSERRR